MRPLSGSCDGLDPVFVVPERGDPGRLPIVTAATPLGSRFRRGDESAMAAPRHATRRSARPRALLAVNNIEVIYDHVILVLKGVSLTVPEGPHRGAARRERRRQDHDAEGDLEPAARRARRRDEGLDRVRRGPRRPTDAERPRQARRDPGHGRPPLLRAPDDRGEPADRRVHAARSAARRLAEQLERVYAYFPRLKVRRTSQAGYTSGGEQQMTAIGRALMARADDDPARRAVDGPRAADRRGDLRDRARPEPEGRRVVPAGRTEHHGRAVATPTTATSSRTAAS